MEASFHKFLCFTHISNPSNHLTFELVIKTICKANTIFPDVDFFMETVEHFLDSQHIDTLNAGQKDFFSIFRLVHNHDKLSKSQLKTIPPTTALTFATFMQFPEFNKKFVTTKHLRFLQHLILHLFHIAEHHLKLFQRKSKDDGKVSFSDFEMYALGMYPFACNISHSCVPNVSYYGNGASLVCKVIRPIRKGDQIFISYRLGVPTFEKVPISAMEKQCRTEYHFKCECIICSTDFFLPTKYEINFTNTKLYKDIMEANSMTIQAFRKLPREKLKYYEECAIKFLERYDRFHPINETIEVWRILITIWLLFTTRFH
ncbi:N-lysine methyltransferase SMYD2-A-like isoform X1 [Sitodiplosis mosellana]|uniref:N-lysine methyltransferase SMYD2-A-like isoform X1 n=1 Tax=Sitodiplosis mosellana TaxID=263140 RepID=UPI002444564E|nr:N-lysine methyltransferase SMYD2-A-like isoform X1 [Sitodiplosis mosellana]